MTTATAFFDVADTALDCVCQMMDDLAATDDAYPGCPCTPYVSPGEPPIDCCTDDCTGMLTVHVEDLFPSEEFPLVATTFEPCKAATWVASIVVTVGRCSPVMDEEGNPAEPDTLTANAAVMGKDSWAVMTALGCCLVQNAPAGRRKRRVQIQGSRPLVADGGCAVIEVRAFVECGPVCNCVNGS